MSLIITFDGIHIYQDLLDVYGYKKANSQWTYHDGSNTIPYIFTGGMLSNNDTLVINNLNITQQYRYIDRNNDLVHALIHLDSGILILNNASFAYFATTSLEYSVYAANMEIYNSIFFDLNSYFYNDAKKGFIYINNGYFIMKNCNVNDMLFPGRHFIYAHNINYGLIDNCYFEWVWWDWYDYDYSVIYFRDGSANNNGDPSVYINNSVFNDIYKSVLYLGDGCDLYVSLNNINIIIDHIEYYSFDLLNPAAASIMITETAKIEMNDVHVMYEWRSIPRSCGFDWIYTIDNSTYVDIWCQMPYRFVSNAGTLSMHNVYITNDLDENKLSGYRNSMLSSGGYKNNTIFRFYFYNHSYSTTNSMIYNDRAQLLINNMTIYGVGVHDEVLHNTGIAYIDNFNLVRPNYYYDNSDFINVKRFMFKVIHNEGVQYSLNEAKCQHSNQCYLDDIQLEIQNGVIITNSNIRGVLMGIFDHHGYIEVYNTLLSDLMIAVHAEKSNTLKIKWSRLENIGYYHMRDYGSIQNSQWFNDEHFYCLDVNNILIEHTTFNYFPRSNYLSIYTQDSNIDTMIQILNNQFVNPITLRLHNTDHFEDFAVIALNYSWYLNHNLDELLNTNPIRDHLVTIEGYIKSSTFVGNTFHPNDIIEKSLNTSCLYIDDYNWFQNNESFHCISGNTFYGLAVHINGGRITSCIHPDLIATNTCWIEFGELVSTDNDNMYDYFIATDIDQAIIKIFNKSHIILDHAVISTNLSINNSNYTDSVYHPFSSRAMHGIISFLDVIIDEFDNDIDITYSEECNNLCTQFYQNDVNNIHQLHINCINTSLTSSSILLSDVLSEKTFIDHSTPTKILLTSSNLFYPGGTMDIDFAILDSNNNTIDDYKGNIDITLSSSDFNFEAVVSITYDESSNDYQCDICKSSLYIQKIRMDESFQNEYQIATKIENNLLSINNFTITITACPSGFGLNAISSQCYGCNVGECSMKSSISPCYSCNNDSLKGVECLGFDKLRITNNYWVGINNVNIKLQNEEIVSQFCPSGYCSQQHNGLYLDLLTSNKLCGINRDPNIPLCGECMDSFSELFGSANCGVCDRNRYELWILFIIIAVIMTVAILYMTAIKTKAASTTSKKRNKSKRWNCICNKKIISFCSIGLSKPIIYYYQSVTFILLNGGIFVSMTAMAEIFNFQLDFGENDTNDESGYCWITGLTAKYEIILRLSLPCLSILTLLMISLVFRCDVNRKWKLCGRRPYFIKAFIKILLLIIGSICGVCFKLVACRPIGDLMVHFYFGNNECYGTTWWVAIFVLIFFVILFCSLFIKLCIDHRNEDKAELFNSDEYILESFVKSYKIKKFWFWELIMFSRRLIIALISINTQDYRAKNTLYIIILIFLLFQAWYKPFKNDKINNIELICLGCLLLIMHISMTQEIYDDIYSILLLNVLITLPLIIFIVEVITMIYEENTKPQMIHQYNSTIHASDNVDHYNDVSEDELEINADNIGHTTWNDIIPVGGRTLTKNNNNALSLNQNESVVLESDSDDSDDYQGKEKNKMVIQMVKYQDKNKLDCDELQIASPQYEKHLSTAL